MMWQGKGCIMYEIFFMNFWVIILCPVFVHYNLKKLKAFFKKTYVFPALVRNDEWYLYWGPRTLLELPGISLET